MGLFGVMIKVAIFSVNCLQLDQWKLLFLGLPFWSESHIFSGSFQLSIFSPTVSEYCLGNGQKSNLFCYPRYLWLPTLLKCPIKMLLFRFSWTILRIVYAWASLALQCAWCMIQPLGINHFFSVQIHSSQYHPKNCGLHHHILHRSICCLGYLFDVGVNWPASQGFLP